MGKCFMIVWGCNYRFIHTIFDISSKLKAATIKSQWKITDGGMPYVVFISTEVDTTENEVKNFVENELKKSNYSGYEINVYVKAVGDLFPSLSIM